MKLTIALAQIIACLLVLLFVCAAAGWMPQALTVSVAALGLLFLPVMALELLGVFRAAMRFFGWPEK